MRIWFATSGSAKRSLQTLLAALVLTLGFAAELLPYRAVARAQSDLSGFYDIYRYPGYAAALLDNRAPVTQDETLDIVVSDGAGSPKAQVTGTYCLRSDVEQDVVLALPFLTSDETPVAYVDGKAASSALRYGLAVEAVNKEDVAKALTTRVPETPAYRYVFPQGPVQFTLRPDLKIFSSHMTWSVKGDQAVLDGGIVPMTVLAIGEEPVYQAPAQPVVTQTTCDRYVDTLFPGMTDEDFPGFKGRLSAAFNRFLANNERYHSLMDLMHEAGNMGLGVLDVPLTLRPDQQTTVTFEYALRPNRSVDYRPSVFAFYIDPVIGLETRSNAALSVTVPEEYPYVLECDPALTREGDRYVAGLAPGQSLRFVVSSTETPKSTTDPADPPPHRPRYGLWIGIGLGCAAAAGLIVLSTYAVVRLRKR